MNPPPQTDGGGDGAREGFYAALVDDDPEELYDRAPCGYLSTRPDGRIVKVNATFLAWTGYQREELVGRRRFVDLLTAGGRIYHETHYAPMLHMQGSAHEIAVDIVGAHGGRFPALVNSVLERDANGVPVVVRTAIFDATERRAYERELLAAKQRAEESERRARLLARTLQQTFLPLAPPTLPGLELAGAYRAAGTGEEVGGDFYDVFQAGPEDWVVALGDVGGKGVEAAVVTALVRYNIRSAALAHPSPSTALGAVNQVLLGHETERLCTVVLLRLHRHPAGWTATACPGGHPLPVLMKAGSPPVAFGAAGTVLGAFDRVQLHDATVELSAGDTLVVYSDGVTEARNGAGFFGQSGLEACLARHPDSARALVDALLSEVLEFQSGFPRDDVVIAALRVPDAPA